MSDLVDNFFCPLGPDKRLRILIIAANIFFYSGYQFGDAPEDSPPNPFSCNLTKPTLYQVKP